MADFSATYTAKRGLTAGHVLGSQQTFEIDLRQLEPLDDIVATQILTPSDAETEFESLNTLYRAETRQMDKATMLLCREFLLSCSGSELFTVSLEGAPVQNAHLILKKKLKPSRQQLKYRYQFDIRVY